MNRILVIGASGTVGSKVVKALEEKINSEYDIVLATSQNKTAEKWREKGINAVILDLNKPETFAQALEKIDRVFLLTSYTADMLVQSKLLIDAAKESGVKYIVHLGTYTSRIDPIPHFIWHDLIENYIASSGMAWTNIHPNVITDTIFAGVDFTTETIEISSWGDVPQGYVGAEDIGEVAATVLIEGPDKHKNKDYYLSIDVLTESELEKLINKITGKPVHVSHITKEIMAKNFEQISSQSIRLYMQSAEVCAELTRNREFSAQTKLCDDVLTVTGHSGMHMDEWLKRFIQNSAVN